jgi:predicted nucleic acid-binding protein
MRIVVSDSSCIIDLRKASLMDVFLRLPYEVLIPNTLFEEELLDITEAQRRALIREGLNIVDLPGAGVLRAQQVIRSAPRLSVNDGFAFALAESHPGCILLTGDSCLRSLAVTHKIEVHDFLWIIDELHRHTLTAADVLSAALRLLAGDPSNRLPRQELVALIKKYDGK